jgi:glycosyltransferase involved in cell wall biosynthesis
MGLKKLKASIVINNYNYGRFLGKAIESSLAQTFPGPEIIVVDDGSTDDSREVMARYDGKIICVFKSNGGQASAFNAGFQKSSGDVIIFLDSDDVLFPSAVEKAADALRTKGLAKAHWSLDMVDENGNKTGLKIPQSPLPEGDLRQKVLTGGPPFCASPPTSGNAWSRRFLESVLPIPENEFRLGADTYLFEMAPFFGPVKRINVSQGAYRIHGHNNYWAKPFETKLQFELGFYDCLFERLDDYCQKLGLKADSKTWRTHSWFHRLDQAVREIEREIPQGEKIILVDDMTWGTGASLSGRTVIPFLEQRGEYAGPPENDVQAQAELERLRGDGAGYLVFSWPSFWWLEHYGNFYQALRLNHPCVLENDRLIIFDLKEKRRG